MKQNYVLLPPTGYNAQWKFKKMDKRNVPICTKKRLPAVCAHACIRPCSFYVATKSEPEFCRKSRFVLQSSGHASKLVLQ